MLLGADSMTCSRYRETERFATYGRYKIKGGDERFDTANNLIIVSDSAHKNGRVVSVSIMPR